MQGRGKEDFGRWKEDFGRWSGIQRMAKTIGCTNQLCGKLHNSQILD